jgi:LAO/AO transport system kinase
MRRFLLSRAAELPQELSPRLTQLLERFEARDRSALARLITLVENRAEDVAVLMDRLYAKTGKAHVVGFTGPPGAGKSTLVNRLVYKYRELGREVAVLAIDPSSPFSGGAVLGDRIRMVEHFRDAGVFIRSLSTRGSRGGLSRAARETTRVLDAFGYDPILIETAGVGQTELAVMDLVHTTVVVTVPESGDAVQVMKAGLNEIADLFVVNKADRPGAERLRTELELSVRLKADGGWRPPVLLAQAANGVGIEAVAESVSKHRAFLLDHRDPVLERERRLREFREILTAELEDQALRGLARGAAAPLVSRVAQGELNPYYAARWITGSLEAIAEVLLAESREKGVADEAGG